MRRGAPLVAGVVVLVLGGCDAPEGAQTRSEASAEAPTTVIRPRSEPARSEPARSEPARSETAPVVPVVPVVEAKVEKVATAAADDVGRPEWERLLKAATRLRDEGPDRYGAADAQEQLAIAAIRALPEDDPRFVEAQCVLAEKIHVGAEVEAALLAGLARLRAHPPVDRYGHLDRVDLISTELGSAILDDGTVQIAPNTGLASAGDCEHADIALLTCLLIDSYHSYGMFKRAYSHVTPPVAPDPFRAASQALIDLHAELVRAEGAKSPRAAALIERFSWACHWSQRKRFPKICVADDRAYAQALPVRVAALGEEHPLTRASLLRVAAQRISESKEAEARALLERAAKGEIESVPQATATALLALYAFRDAKVDEALGLFARIEAAGDRTYGDNWWSYGHVLQVYSDALRVARRYPEALRVYRHFMAIQPASRGGRWTPYPGHAELLAAAGEHAEAIEEYGRRLEYDTWLEETGGNQPARQMGREQRLRDLRARGAVRRAIGDASGAEADLAEATRIEAGSPVRPD